MPNSIMLFLNKFANNVLLSTANAKAFVLNTQKCVARKRNKKFLYHISVLAHFRYASLT